MGAKSPLLWDEGQVDEYLAGSPLVAEIKERLKVGANSAPSIFPAECFHIWCSIVSLQRLRSVYGAQGIEKEYAELDTVWFMAGSLFKSYPYDVPTEAFSLKLFRQVWCACMPCIFNTLKENPTALAFLAATYALRGRVSACCRALQQCRPVWSTCKECPCQNALPLCRLAPLCCLTPPLRRCQPSSA